MLFNFRPRAYAPHSNVVEFLPRAEGGIAVALPLFEFKVPAGFPSPAEDHVQDTLSADSYLVRNPRSTFFVRVKGDSMIEARIFDGDVLVVDRSIDPQEGQVVLAELDGEFTVKTLGRGELVPANKRYKPLRFQDHQNVAVLGVVVGVMRKVG